MAKTLSYTGGLGPARIVCGGVHFVKGEARVIEDDALAGQLLAKGYFEEVKSKPAAKAVKVED